jgi:hypothetical protein
MSGEVKVDDAFFDAVSKILPRCSEEFDFARVVRATLAVAAERGLIVPDDAPKAWAVAEFGKPCPGMVFATHTAASKYAPQGTAVVRVAVVEIKEDGK